MNQINQFISTVDIAEAMEVSHKTILQKLEGANRHGKHTDGVIDILGRLNLQPSDFFIKSSYINNQNKEMPCYNCTRKGCEFLAHKFQGEKGIRFTATYINKFHEMEETITQIATESDKQSQLSTEEIVDWKLNDLHKRVKELEGDKPDDAILIDLKLNDLHKRLKALEKKEADRENLQKQTKLAPRNDTWYEKNRNRIWRIRYDKGMEIKELYHIILEACSQYYDLVEAERIYKEKKGCVPAYPISLVEYFPELQDIANQILDYYEQQY